MEAVKLAIDHNSTMLAKASSYDLESKMIQMPKDLHESQWRDCRLNIASTILTQFLA